MNILALLLIMNLPLGGYLRFEGYGRIDSLKVYEKLATSMQLRLAFESGDVEGYGAFNFSYDRIKNTTSVQPVEGYFSIEKGPLGITLGKKIISIGTADWINPTDVISPKDYSTLHSDMEEFKKGVEEVNLDLNVSNFLFSMYVFPVFTPDQIPLHPFSIVTPFLEIDFDPSKVDQPGFDAKYTQYGLRTHGYVSNVDFSLTYLNIYDRSPDLKEIPVKGTPPVRDIKLCPAYYPIKMFGADFSTSISGWEIHGEGAYFMTQDKDGTNPLIKNPYIYAVAGGNRTFFDEKVKFGLQGGIKYVINFKDSTYFHDPINAMLYSIARKFNYQTHEKTYYGTITLGYNSPSGDWSADGTLIYDITDGDYFTIPKVIYSPADAVNVIFGLFLSGGKGTSPFSEMGKHVGQLAFVEIKYSF